MNYLLFKDLDILKDRVKEINTALAILNQVGFPDGFVVKLLQSEKDKLIAEIIEEEKYL